MKKFIFAAMVFGLFFCGSAWAYNVDLPGDYRTNDGQDWFFASDTNGDVTVAVGENGRICVSKDNVNWEEVRFVTFSSLNHVAWDGYEFEAFSDKAIFKSSDGYHWTEYPDDGRCELYSHNNVILDLNIPKNQPFELPDKGISFTGKDYVKIDETYASDTGSTDKLYQSDDGKTWNYIKQICSKEDYTAEEYMLFCFLSTDYSGIRGQIINTGNEYLVREGMWDNGYSPRQREYDGGEIYVYDLNFNFVKKIKFNEYIMQMSYLDGICYVLYDRTYDLYKSSDLETWTKVENGIGVPMRNKYTTIFETFATVEYGDPFSLTNFTSTAVRCIDGVPGQRVAMEDNEFNRIFVLGDYFFSINNSIENGRVPSFSYSKDGIYWATQKVPGAWGIDYIILSEDSIYVVKDDFVLKYSLSDINATVPYQTDYVQVNGNILGFDVPPANEDGRLLVPMRFLFEQMGAQVAWDGGTQTATVTKDGKQVSFQINNNSANVGGETKAMDVPARLIKGRTMVPLRFLSENLGYNVRWDSDSHIVAIN